MPRRVIDSGPDMLAGDHSGVAATIDGYLFPVADNLLPDPRFKALDQYGILEGYDPPAHPPTVRALSIYGRPPGGVAQYAVRTKTIEQAAIVLGVLTEIMSPKPPSPLAVPPAPRNAVLPNGSYTLLAGSYGLAFALLRDGRATAPSPRALVTVNASPNVSELAATLGLTAAQLTAADQVQILLTEPVAAVDVPTAPLYVQDTIDLEDATDVLARLRGPWRAGALAVASNETYAEAQGPLDWSYEPVAGASIEGMTLEVTWSYTTSTGRAPSQQIATIAVTTMEDAAIAVKPPHRPPDAISWRAEWREVGWPGQWLTYGDEPDFDEPQLIYSTEVDDETELVNLTAFDESGLANPTQAPVVATSYPATVAGTWKFAVSAHYPLPDTDLPEGEVPLMESAVSEEVPATILANDAVRVDARPPDGNLLYNPLGTQRTPAIGKPRGNPVAWTFAPGVTGDVVDGVANCTDTTGVQTPEFVLALDAVPIDGAAGQPVTIFAALDFTRFVGGRVTLIGRQLDAGGGSLGDTVLYTTEIGQDLIERDFTFAPTTVLVRDHDLNASARSLEFLVRHEGYTDALGNAVVRNLDWSLRIAIYDGWASPRKVPASKRLGGGYVDIVENPAHRPASLAGMDLNMAEYFGPPGAPVREAQFLKGLRLPVRPGQTYTVSIYAEARGLAEGSTLFASMFRDEKGNVALLNDPIITYAGGGALNSAYSRYGATFLAPDNAAYWELAGSRLGPGRARVIGFQWQKGINVTPFDPGIDPDSIVGEAGWIEFVMDLASPEPEDDPGDIGTIPPPGALKNLSEVVGAPELEFVGEGVLGTTFASGASESGPWSAFVADPTLLTIDNVNHYLLIRMRVGNA